MPEIYDIDYTIVANLLLPPSKRTPRHLAWIRSLLKPCQYLRDLFFGTFRKGSTNSFFSLSTPYHKYDRVIWSDRGVYECQANISGVRPAGDATSSTYWRKILDCFIGADERLRYSSQNIMLVYAMNRWFFNPAPANQIYLAAASAPPYRFKIMIPATLYSTLGPTGPEADANVRSFVNRYVVVGIQYEIGTY